LPFENLHGPFTPCFLSPKHFKNKIHLLAPIFA
jgi:hypothetical protein